MVGCSVSGCQSRSEYKMSGISFHTFPLDPIINKQWINAVGRTNWVPSKYSRICSVHFDATQLITKNKRKGLLIDAVPTKFVHTQSSEPSATTNETIVVVTSEQQEDKPEILPLTLEDRSQPSMMRTAKQHLQCLETGVSKKQCLTFPSTSKCTKSSITAGAAKQHQEWSETCVSEIQNVRMKVSPRAAFTPRKKKIQQKIKKLQQSSRLIFKKLRAVRQSRRRYIKKTADLKSVLDELKNQLLIGSEDRDILDSIGEGNADVIKAVLGKTKLKKYSEEVRKFSLSLNYISPKAYEYVRKEFNTCLPHPKTLSKWYSCIDCEPGFTSESFEAVKKLVDRSTTPLICALSLDEMSIRQHLQWDGRRTVGYINIGNNLDCDNLPLAKDALVFMLTCLNGHWKLPVGYFLTNGVNGDQRSLLLKNCIELAFKSGVQVAAVTFDGCPSNFAMARLLGASFDDPSNIQPVITIDGNKIVVMPDACHMIKLVRNTLGDKKNLIDSDNEIISWEFVEKLHNLQDNEGLHLANKLRNTHVKYKKQIMKVRLATQTFSRSVAESILFCKNRLKLKEFDNCNGTVKFIKLFNDLFDILNSRQRTASGFKKPISENNWLEIKTALDAARNYILGLKFLDGQNVITSGRKTGFVGFLTCIEAIIFLYTYYIKETKHLLYITTFRLSQDHLELFFSAIRSKGGFNNNPTAMQFKAAYKRLLIHGEIKNINSGNCIQADVNILTSSCHAVNKINKSKSKLLAIDDENHSTDIPHSYGLLEFPEGHDYVGQMCLSQFSKEIVAYIAGFVTTKLTNIIKCDECIGALCSVKFEGFISHKDRGGLRYPSQDVVKICTDAENVLRGATKANGLSFLEKVTALPMLVSSILKKYLSREIFVDLNEHLKEQNPMNNHLILLIKAIGFKYLEVRVHHMMKKACQKEENIRNFSNKMVLFKGQ